MPGFVVSNGPISIGGSSFASDDVKPSARAEFYYKYTWEILNLFELDGASGDSIDYKNPLIYLRDATLPTFSANVDSVTGASLEYKWAKSVVWEDVNITWYDSIGLVDKIREWREMVWSQEYGLQVGSVYKKESQIVSMLPTMGKSGAVIWTLKNSWPRVIKYGDLTYTQSEVKLIDVTVAYDWAEENGGSQAVRS